MLLVMHCAQEIVQEDMVIVLKLFSVNVYVHVLMIHLGKIAS